MSRVVPLLTCLSLLTLATACGGTDSGTPDATLAPDATASCHTLYLNFEGAAVIPGAENATTDHSSIAGNSGTIAPYRTGDAGRTASIAAITAQVTSTLAPLGVSVVTVRPSSGAYDMIVLGGTGADIGVDPNVAALAISTCDQVPTALDFVFDFGRSDVEVANTALGTYGVSLGVGTSTSADDCMCFNSSSCTNTSAACSIGGASTPRDPGSLCGTGATFDEHAAFASALACP